VIDDHSIDHRSSKPELLLPDARVREALGTAAPPTPDVSVVDLEVRFLI
jgi:hypothetical protein